MDSAHTRRYFIASVLITLVAGAVDADLLGTFMERRASADWPSVEGTITRNKREAYKTSEGEERTRVHLEYRFAVKGKEQIASRYRVTDYWNHSASEHEMAEFAGKHPSGTRVTVYYNSSDASQAALVVGLQRYDGLVLLFLTLFHVGVIGAWGGFFWRRWCDRQRPLQGVPVMEREGETRIRLPRQPPPAAALAAALITAVATLLALAFAPSVDIGAPVVGGTWAAILLAAVGVYVWQKAVIDSGIKDLVINPEERLLTLPRTYWRWSNEPISIDRVTGVELQVLAWGSYQAGWSRRYSPRLVHLDADDKERHARLAVWPDEKRAQNLVDWLRERLGLEAEKENRL